MKKRLLTKQRQSKSKDVVGRRNTFEHSRHEVTGADRRKPD